MTASVEGDPRPPRPSDPSGPSRPGHWLGRLRGVLAISGAKVWFLLIGLAQTVLLPAVMGQAGFGAYRRALAFVNVLNAVVVVGSLQAVSQAVSRAEPAARPKTIRFVLPIHAAMAAALGLAFFLLAPLISQSQHAPQLLAPLRVLSAVVVAYGIYAPLVGALNGLGCFGTQAALDVTASTLRTALSVGVAAWFVREAARDVHVDVVNHGGVLGASLGFLASCLLLIPIAWLALRRRLRAGPGPNLGPLEGSGPGEGPDEAAVPGGRGPTGVSVGLYLHALLGLLLLQVLQALLLQFDLMVLGRAATLSLRAEGAEPLVAARLGDQLAGLYAQAQTFGLVPFQLLLAATHVLFPAVAAAHARGDGELLATRVREGGRLALIVGGVLVAALIGAPTAVLRVAFGSVPQVLGAPQGMATHVLRILTLAHLVTAIATLGTTLLAAAGQFRRALVGATVLTVAAMTGVVLGAWSAASAQQLPEHIALGLFGGLIVGALWIMVSVERHLGRLVVVAVLARVALALVCATCAGWWVPQPAGRLLCVLVPLVPVGVFIGMLWLLGEQMRLRTQRS